MATAAPLLTGSKSQSLVKALRNDLFESGFEPGQQFHTINEISAKYRVSRMTAIKCLDQLVREGLVIRRHGAGTYVQRVPGPTKLPASQQPVTRAVPPCVDFVTPYNIEARAGADTLQILMAFVYGSLPEHGLAARMNLLPARAMEAEEMESWLESRVHAGAQAFVFHWMPRLAQEIVLANKWPTIVVGRPERGIHLPFVDSDQQQVGSLIGDYLINQDCKAIAVLMRSEWRPGDNLMFNSLLGHLGKRLAHVEACPSVGAEVDSIVQNLLKNDPTIDALVMRCQAGPWMTSHVDELVKSRGIRVIQATPWKKWSPLITSVAPQVGQHFHDAVCEGLRQILTGRTPSPANVELSVTLDLPASENAPST